MFGMATIRLGIGPHSSCIKRWSGLIWNIQIQFGLICRAVSKQYISSI